MWKQPTEKELGAPKDIALLIRESVYWNSEGHLDHAPTFVILQYVFSLIVGNLIIVIILSSILQVIGLGGILAWIILCLFSLGILTGVGYWFYGWGWKSYREMWYHFNNKDEIFTAILRNDGNWETIEIPYEEIDSVEYIQSPNGKALINSGQFEFETNRMREKRFSSITELWPNLARFDAKMINWPITLFCSVCQRSFGHHIGTAICPWDNVALLDLKAKGRFDPEGQNIDDLDRI